MGLTRKVKRNLDNSSGLPPELQDSINSLFDDFYGKEVDDDEEDDEESDISRGSQIWIKNQMLL